jgi:hypothetical protein
MFKKFSILFNVFILTTISLIGLMLVPATSHACSCVESPAPKVELQNKTAVFSGKVLSIKEPSKLLNWSSADPVKVTFEVYQVWKGGLGKKVSVQTAMDGASCGFEFEQNQEYLVYANGDISNLEASLCSRTQSILTSGNDIQALGTAIKSPMNELSEDDSTPNDNVKYYILAVGSLVAVILLFIAVMRKKLRS